MRYIEFESSIKPTKKMKLLTILSSPQCPDPLNTLKLPPPPLKLPHHHQNNTSAASPSNTLLLKPVIPNTPILHRPMMLRTENTQRSAEGDEGDEDADAGEGVEEGGGGER